jgi:hypothetical protein
MTLTVPWSNSLLNTRENSPVCVLGGRIYIHGLEGRGNNIFVFSVILSGFSVKLAV